MVCHGQARIEPNGFGIGGDGFGSSFELPESEATIEVQERVFWLDFDRSIEIPERPVELAGQQIDRASIGVGLRALGPIGQSTVAIGERLTQFSPRNVNNAPPACLSCTVSQVPASGADGWSGTAWAARQGCDETGVEA